ncbi:MAG: arginine--tRNA ligase [Clostridia bacterium]
MNLKEIIVDAIKFDKIDKKSLTDLIVAPKDSSMGDFSLACFSLAKILHESPSKISEEIKESVQKCDEIEKIECVNGYVNFFFSMPKAIPIVMANIEKKNFGQNVQSNKKTMCIDYCSVNLAKYMHIGHWATTIIGESIARIYESQGYKVVRINYLGDFGTTFGKMVYAYKTWGNKEDVVLRGVDAIQELYVKFCANENEDLLNLAREVSLNIENEQGEDFETYEWFISIAKKECERLITKTGIKFDDWKGESAYNKSMGPVLEELSNKNLIKKSDGATICDLEQFGLGIALVQRSDGASLYLTRDLAAIEDRSEKYHFDEMIYVTAIQQNRHFEQLFKICELLEKPYSKNLYHAGYGMFALPEGKIASRKGKQALFEDILNMSESKVGEIIKDRNLPQESKAELLSKIGKSAIAFSVLKIDRIKDKIFDLETAISFDGETAPYIQYTVARINSLIRKIEALGTSESCQCELTNRTLFSLLREAESLDDVVFAAFNKKEPSIIARQLIAICSLFNKVYAEEKFVDSENMAKTKALEMVCKEIKRAIVYGMQLVCVDYVDQM